MTGSSKSSTRTSAGRLPDAGVGRLGGIAIAATTAAIVFFAGRPFLPRPGEPHPGAPRLDGLSTAPVAPAPSAQPTSSISADATVGGDAARGLARRADAASAGDAASVAMAAEAGAATEATRTVGADSGAPSPSARPTPQPALEAAEAPDGPAKPRAAVAESQADKDQAREAWRANRPDIRVSGNRASILIPLKGSIEGGTYKLLRKRRTLVVTLPHAASLNTQHFYRLRRHGFVALWTEQSETNARARDGTRLRVVLGADADPQVELRDDYVRVTILRPGGAGGHDGGGGKSESEDGQ